MGNNIVFTNSVYSYWWSGVAADGSVLALTAGVLGLFFLPRDLKPMGWILIGLGILLVFISSRAILNPTSLWQFFVCIASFAAGYQLMTTGKIRL
ncbi:MAG: hypothetical protein ACRC6M_08005 [Microcystaceae cyanobacterium]